MIEARQGREAARGNRNLAFYLGSYLGSYLGINRRHQLARSDAKFGVRGHNNDLPLQHLPKLIRKLD